MVITFIKQKKRYYTIIIINKYDVHLSDYVYVDKVIAKAATFFICYFKN